MIHKVVKLTSIGKFRDYQAAGDVAFKKITLFYGDNGGGKTTLTAILRSLSQNNPNIITKRKSTNQNTPQAAQIIHRIATGDTHHTFNHTTGWTTPIPDIEIFDIHFVNDNVYSGCDFNDDQKKQLHQFVIGAVGVSIQQQLDQNKLNKTVSRQNQTTIEQQIIQQVGNNMTDGLINSFLAISQTEAHNINELISTAETALANANANSVIQTLSQLSRLTQINSGVNFTALILDLETSSQAIQDAALKALFDSHCQDLSSHTITGPENWLRTGFSYLENKKAITPNGATVVLSCPFCQQTLDNNIQIINAYTLQFNQAFNSLVQRIQTHLTSLQAFNIVVAIQAIKDVDQMNSERINSWRTHLPEDVQSPPFNIITDEDELKKQYQSLIELVQSKLQNPSVAKIILPATTFLSALETINSNIDSYNQTVITYNNNINEFRAGIQTVVQADAEVNRLQRIKKRFDPTIVGLCTQLTTERQNLRTLESTYTQLSAQQQTATATFFTNYKDRINHYLSTVFKTLFRIEDVAHVPPQGRATQSKVGYKLTIDGQDISFDHNQNNSTKDCLSEGDKSSIALAFFLSKLDIDPELANKIVVFDDPLSSFDSNRRMYTVQLIKDLLPRVKQIIVLSHNEFFLYEISKGVSNGDKKILRITENFATKASTIEPLILESMVENDYFKHIKELETFLQRPDLNKKDIVLGWLRNVLEAHLRFKFYRQLSGLAPNNQTFGNVITTLVSQNVVFRDNVNRVAIISKLNLINGISCKPHHGEATPDYAILGTDPNTMNVTELAGFVTDTLDLVDNKL